MPYPVTFTLHLLVPAPISFGEKMWANEGVPNLQAMVQHLLSDQWWC